MCLCELKLIHCNYYHASLRILNCKLKDINVVVVYNYRNICGR